MTHECDTTQGRILTEDLGAVLSEDAVREHLASCSECGGLGRQLQSLHRLMETTAKHDVQDSVVATLVARVAADRKKRRGVLVLNRFLFGTKALSAAIMLSAFLLFVLLSGIRLPIVQLFILGGTVAAFVYTLRGQYRVAGALVSFALCLFTVTSVSIFRPTQLDREFRSGETPIRYNDVRMSNSAAAILSYIIGDSERTAVSSSHVEPPLPPPPKVMKVAPAPGEKWPSIAGALMAGSEDEGSLRQKYDQQYAIGQALAGQAIAGAPKGPGVAANAAGDQADIALNDRRSVDGPVGDSELEPEEDLRADRGKGAAASALPTNTHTTVLATPNDDYDSGRSAEIFRRLLERVAEEEKGKNELQKEKSVVIEADASKEAVVKREFRRNAVPLPDGPASGVRDGKRDRSRRDEDTISVAQGSLTDSPALGKKPALPASYEDSVDLLSRLFPSRSVISGLSLKPAQGYWANSYVPTDPELRDLATRVLGTEGSELRRSLGGVLKLEAAAHRPRLLIDPPTSAALALTVTSDQSAVEGASRLLLQVGMRATDRAGGARPALNVGLILDLRGSLTPEVVGNFKALLLAFEKSAQSGDRFSVTIAGRIGGVIIRPGEFRHGTVAVALQQLFDTPAPAVAAGAKILSLEEAFDTTVRLVRAGDDQDAPLGSSMVVLVTSQALSNTSSSLAKRAHATAVNGVPVSAISVGGTVEPQELNRIVLAGQGNRSAVVVPGDALAVVQRELTSVSRVVARAIRLSIRLAPGVKLVDVIGSKSLTAAAAQRVRVAEQSIDRRMAKNLGIEADRGKDEDGIEIVIPAFFSGDSHSILLDVVAPKAGKLVEVRVKYKDLVFLKNGNAQTTLSVNPGRAAQGARELAVVKGFLAQLLSKELGRAAEYLHRGSGESAAAVLGLAEEQLRQALSFSPLLSQDADLLQDLAMLAEYRRVIRMVPQPDGQLSSELSESLRFAGKKKVQSVLAE